MSACTRCGGETWRPGRRGRPPKICYGCGQRPEPAPGREPRGRCAAGVVSGQLDVTCWCEAEIVRVPIDEIASGRTRPCCRPKCRRLGEVAA